MTARTGLTLRLVGPLIEVICLIALSRVHDQGRLFFGLPVEYILYAGLAAGLALVVVGLTMVRPGPRGPGGLG